MTTLSKKDERLITLAMKGGNDASLVLLDSIEEVDKKVEDLAEKTEKDIEKLDEKITTEIEEIKKEIPNLEKFLDNVRGTQGIQGEMGEKGDEPSDMRLIELIKPLIPNPIPGKDGRDGRDGIDGKDGINGKDGKHGTDGKDGSPDKPDEIRDKLESIKDGDKLSIQAIQDLAEKLEELGKKIVGVKGQKYGSIRTRYIDDLTPTGAINGSNTVFTISKTPETGSLKVYVNGARMRITEDYTFSGKTITFNTAPPTSSIVLVDFRY